jgi:hypothetical protein
MGSTKYTPTVSKKDFDSISNDLRAEFKRKYEASKNDADRPPANPATKGAFDHVPNLDSKTVASWSPIVKKYLGCRLNPELITKGGYDSFGAFWDNMAPQLRASCPESLPGRPSAEVLQAAAP